jgi:hypothetical protein
MPACGGVGLYRDANTGTVSLVGAGGAPRDEIANEVAHHRELAAACLPQQAR